MQGIVKWFSQEKGYGFVTDQTSTDRHFSVRDVRGATLPSTGSVIDFEPADGKKGPRAQNVRIISQPVITPAEKRDDRAVCGACGKKMVPRLITNRGQLERSVCPFCGTTHKRFNFPWIAAFIIAAVAWLIFGGYLG